MTSYNNTGSLSGASNNTGQMINNQGGITDSGNATQGSINIGIPDHPDGKDKSQALCKKNNPASQPPPTPATTNSGSIEGADNNLGQMINNQGSITNSGNATEGSINIGSSGGP